MSAYRSGVGVCCEARYVLRAVVARVRRLAVVPRRAEEDFDLTPTPADDATFLPAFGGVALLDRVVFFCAHEAGVAVHSSANASENQIQRNDRKLRVYQNRRVAQAPGLPHPPDFRTRRRGLKVRAWATTPSGELDHSRSVPRSRDAAG